MPGFAQFVEASLPRRREPGTKALSLALDPRLRACEQNKTVIPRCHQVADPEPMNTDISNNSKPSAQDIGVRVHGFLCVGCVARLCGREIVGFPIGQIASRPDPRPRTA